VVFAQQYRSAFSAPGIDAHTTPCPRDTMEDIILDRISFGGVKELEEIYSKLLSFT
jgi:hypothetical protein